MMAEDEKRVKGISVLLEESYNCSTLEENSTVRKTFFFFSL